MNHEFVHIVHKKEYRFVPFESKKHADNDNIFKSLLILPEKNIKTNY